MNPNKKCIRPLGINVIANLNINIAIKRNMNININININISISININISSLQVVIFLTSIYINTRKIFDHPRWKRPEE